MMKLRGQLEKARGEVNGFHKSRDALRVKLESAQATIACAAARYAGLRGE